MESVKSACFGLSGSPDGSKVRCGASRRGGADIDLDEAALSRLALALGGPVSAVQLDRLRYDVQTGKYRVPASEIGSRIFEFYLADSFFEV